MEWGVKAVTPIVGEITGRLLAGVESALQGPIALSTACLSHALKHSLGIKNKSIFQKVPGQNASELPRRVIYRVLDSINRKFFFIRLVLFCSPEGNRITNDKGLSC